MTVCDTAGTPLSDARCDNDSLNDKNIAGFEPSDHVLSSHDVREVEREKHRGYLAVFAHHLMSVRILLAHCQGILGYSHLMHVEWHVKFHRVASAVLPHLLMSVMTLLAIRQDIQS